MSTDSTKVLPVSALESLPVELLFKIASEVILSTNPGPKQGHFPPITGTRRSEKISTGIHAVSLASRRLHNLANAVLYRTVVLDGEKDVSLFGRTVSDAVDATRSGRTGQVAITLTFLQDAVKRLAITYAPMTHADLACVFALRKSNMNDVISTIITACSGVHTIAIHSQWAPILCNIGMAIDGSKSGNAFIGSTLTELLLSSYTDLAKTCRMIPPIAQWQPSAPSTPVRSPPMTPSGTRPSSPDPARRPHSIVAPNNPPEASIFGHVTHLRIAEPAYYSWYSPLALLKVFASLTHIALPRRAHANVENDELFIEDIKAILREPRIQVIVVTIFPRLQAVDHDTVGGSMDIKDSTIWLAAEKLRKGDGRVFVTMNTRMGDWRKDWQVQRVVASADGPDNWWRKAMDWQEFRR